MIPASTFDKWRADYDSMTFEEMQDFYDWAHGEHPSQRHFNVDAVMRWLEQMPQRAVILELGGYDGELADICLPLHPEMRWVNLEISHVPSVCSIDRYRTVTLECWPWEIEAEGFDGFLASHSMEHLSDDHASKMLNAADVAGCSSIYIDMPEGNWGGATALHKLEMGWIGVDRLLVDRGYKNQWTMGGEGEARAYRR